MHLTTLFEKFHEHEMELKKLVEDEKGNKKIEYLLLRSKKGKYSDSGEDMTLMV